MYRILVIEDEEDIQEILKNYLTAEGYEVVTAEDGVDGIAKFHESSFDLILLDVMMPKIDGFGTCELIRRESQVPVLPRRISAVLRRVHKESGPGQLCYQSLRMDLAGYHVYVADREAELTQKEFELLHVLLLNQGIVLTRQKLLNLVWGEDYFGEERIVDTHIKNLRKKLGVNYISTIRGVGYRIDKDDKK